MSEQTYQKMKYYKPAPPLVKYTGPYGQDLWIKVDVTTASLLFCMSGHGDYCTGRRESAKVALELHKL